MIRALESALGGYVARSVDLSRLAEKIRSQPADENLAANLVGMMVNQRSAEADLVVARVADETSESLMHVIA